MEAVLFPEEHQGVPVTSDPLIAFLEKRSPRHFAAVVRAYQEVVLDAAFRILGDRDQAEDIAQEVFLKLLTVKWSPERIRSPRGLLLSTAILTALSRARAEERRSAREAEAQARRTKGEPVWSRDDILDVRDAVLELPEGLRAVVELRYYGGLTVKEVAVTLGSSPETVKDRLARARGHLRDHLGPGAWLVIGAIFTQDGAQPLPSLYPSPALRRALRRLGRDGISFAALAAGATAGGGALKPMAATLLAATILALGAWLYQSGTEAPAALGRASAPVAPARMLAIPAPAHSARDPTAEPPPTAAAAVPTPRDYRLIDDEGQPAGGARLVFAKRFVDERVPAGLAETPGTIREDKESVLWSWATHSDPDGGFDFPAFFRDQPAGGLELLVMKRGFVCLFTRYPGVIPAPGSTVELRRAPIVRLEVLNESGAPVDRFHLRLDPNLEALEVGAAPDSPFYAPLEETDVEASDGVHRFQPSIWNWAEGLTITAPGYPPHQGRFFPYSRGGSGRDLVVRLKGERLLRGVVLDPAGLPVPGAEVIAGNESSPVRLDLGTSGWACPGRYLKGAGAHRVSCGSDGSFTIAALPGETWLVGQKDRLTPGWAKVGEDARAAPVVLTLGRHGQLRAACFDGADLPRAGARVEVRLLGYDRDPGPITTARRQENNLPVQLALVAYTDPGGLALFEDLPPGHYYWFQTLRKLQIRPSEVTEVVDREPLPEPASPPGATTRLFGRITVAGKPLVTPKDVSLLSIAGRDVFTDAGGRYALEGVEPGEHWVQGPEPLGPRNSMRLAVAPGQREVEFSWNFPLCRFGGRIISAAEGRPIEGAHLEVSSEVPGGFSTRDYLKASADGSLPTAPGPPCSSGRYLLAASAPGFEVETQECSIGDEAPERFEFEFHLRRARSSLALRLESAIEARMGLDLLEVRLIPERLVMVAPEEPTGDGGSGCTWWGLPAGCYTVAVDASRTPGLKLGFAYATAVIPEGGGAIERTLCLPPSGELAVEVRDASGRRFADPRPRVRLERFDGAPAAPPFRLRTPRGTPPDPRVLDWPLDPSSSLHLQAMPVGLYRLSAARPGFNTAEATAEVTRGRLTEVILTLSR
jgi:RNA polymerase sigma factor (sigma-70 family)